MTRVTKNPKSEYRMPKQIRMTKIQKNVVAYSGKIRISCLFGDSDFDIRI